MTPPNYLPCILIVLLAGCESGASSKQLATDYNRIIDREAVVEEWKAKENPSTFPGDLSDPKLVDILPVPLKMEPPTLPPGRLHGNVTLEFVVTSLGTVEQITVVNRPSPILAQAAIK